MKREGEKRLEMCTRECLSVRWRIYEKIVTSICGCVGMNALKERERERDKMAY